MFLPSSAFFFWGGWSRCVHLIRINYALANQVPDRPALRLRKRAVKLNRHCGCQNKR